MREFSISNKSGEVYNLNNLRNFMHDPTGLGFVRSSSYTQIGDRYEILRDSFEQATPSGMIRFKNEPQNSAYDKYMKFTRFLQDIPLTLHYRSNKHHMIDVVADILQKTEYTKALGGLDVALSFRALSKWYDEVEDAGTTKASLYSDTRNDGPCHIEITGVLTDPVWIQKVNGVQIMSGKVTASIASGETLHIRTDTNPYQMYKTDGSGTVTDLYGSSDFSTERFVLLEYGENSIECTGAASVKVRGRLYYETV